MRIPYYHVDAFASEQFRGNPAGVCLLHAWLPDKTLMRIAAENRHSETAFVVMDEDSIRLRWFTPVKEVNLCGHATLATAFVMFEYRQFAGSVIHFETNSGTLTVEREGDLLVLDLPSRPTEPCDTPGALLRALGQTPLEVRRARAYLAVLVDESSVRDLQPDLNAILELDAAGLIVTAPGVEVEFVSRYFAPKLGVPEDPVTGSAHCALTPYWSKRLGKTRMNARQLSARGGELTCDFLGERVKLGGRAVNYLSGVIELD